MVLAAVADGVSFLFLPWRQGKVQFPPMSFIVVYQLVQPVASFFSSLSSSSPTLFQLRTSKDQISHSFLCTLVHFSTFIRNYTILLQP